MSLLAGESVGLIDEIRPAAEVLRETISGAERCAGPSGSLFSNSHNSQGRLSTRIASSLFPFRDVLRIDAKAEMHFGLFLIPAAKVPLKVYERAKLTPAPPQTPFYHPCRPRHTGRITAPALTKEAH